MSEPLTGVYVVYAVADGPAVLHTDDTYIYPTKEEALQKYRELSGDREEMLDWFRTDTDLAATAVHIQARFVPFGQGVDLSEIVPELDRDEAPESGDDEASDDEAPGPADDLSDVSSGEYDRDLDLSQ